MSLSQFLAYLYSNATNVINFVSNFILSAISLIGNFWNILTQQKTQAVNEADIKAASRVLNLSTFLGFIIKTGDDLLHGRITNVIIDFQFLLSAAQNTLISFVDAAKSEGKLALEQTYSVLLGLVSTAETNFTKLLEHFGLSFTQRLDQLTLEFNKIFTMSGLSLAEKRALLKMFLDDPLGFIASAVVEIAIPLILWELTRGLTDADIDIGDPPIITSIASDKLPRLDVEEPHLIE